MADSESATDSTTYDAIVVGSGIAGGWAAKELCEKGLKTDTGGEFASLQQPGRERLLREMDTVAQADKDHWFNVVRELAVDAYFSSEIGLTRAMRYSITPGRYEACVPLEPGQPAWG